MPKQRKILLSIKSLRLKRRLLKKLRKLSWLKVGKVMGEFKDKSLHSGKGGPVVKNPKQAIAIALSEARKVKKK